MFGEEFTPLDFSVIANNDNAVTLTIIDRNTGIAVPLTGMTVLWGLFLNGVKLFGKTSGDVAQINILDQSQFPGQLILYIDAADTAALVTGTEYIHEFVCTDSTSKSANVSKADKFLSPGKMFIRRQYQAQA